MASSLERCSNVSDLTLSSPRGMAPRGMAPRCMAPRAPDYHTVLGGRQGESCDGGRVPVPTFPLPAAALLAKPHVSLAAGGGTVGHPVPLPPDGTGGAGPRTTLYSKKHINSSGG